nr:cardiolipin synthase ClsB [Lysobacter chinensis]
MLENGEAYFPAAFAAIDAAAREILLETFIWFEDEVGWELHRRLLEAAQRGVRVEVLVDGYGSPGFTPQFLQPLLEAGVRLRVFDHRPRRFGVRLHVFRRMHRKLLVVDGRRAFIGGINYAADHLAHYGPGAKQDYAVELEGPIVADVHSFVECALATHGIGHPWRPQPKIEVPQAGDARIMFLPRDNDHRSTSIEHEYRRAIRAARRELMLANAYFFPGYGFLRDLRQAARRGVRVTLIVQGEPDTPIALTAARVLYAHLLDAGISVHEYCERPFHGKVAYVDDEWCTVGSSNLDPLSLSLNLEANIFIHDRAFVDDLRTRLQALIRQHCRAVDRASVPRQRFWQPLTRPLLFHCLRRFPDWASRLPAPPPRTALMHPPEAPGPEKS